ncbi:DUF1835 domain-containing protein [Clostridium sp. D2Q-14]|uniref:DUF3658 domain-containing protein n=1 Tax=Anaeromonas gelatinilytica TaxID=2683194 RepID=UPI00193C6A36|nr:DUF3658 domain-containing protein [Anaeromonas gelatinilytica]MBS4536794.1 DUF1835 domain-containing protein [Anaeromonas gelatinilytica]
MVEVLFGESESGAMKAAKDENVIIGGHDGSTSFLGKNKKKRRTQGKQDEVVCLSFMLDIGDIKEAIDSQYRRELIFSMYTQNGWEDSLEVLEELHEAGNKYVHELNRLIEFARKGHPLRIWYSNAPYSLCGFYYICSVLRKFECEISVVKLPDYIIKKENVITYQNWGEIVPEDFNKFLDLKKKLSKMEIIMFADEWSKLVEDNSSLRALINGRLVGVSDDFYDYLIVKEMTDKPIKEARLIGNILGKYPLSIGDWWYAVRIELMLERGQLKVVEDSTKKYTRTIGKV